MQAQDSPETLGPTPTPTPSTSTSWRVAGVFTRPNTTNLLRSWQQGHGLRETASSPQPLSLSHSLLALRLSLALSVCRRSWKWTHTKHIWLGVACLAVAFCIQVKNKYTHTKIGELEPAERPRDRATGSLNFAHRAKVHDAKSNLAQLSALRSTFSFLILSFRFPLLFYVYCLATLYKLEDISFFMELATTLASALLYSQLFLRSVLQ